LLPVALKKVPFGQTGMQRPSDSTGRADGQVRQLVADESLQVAQSGWQGEQMLLACTVEEGHDDTQMPLEARPLAQDVQCVEVPTHILQLDSQAEYALAGLASRAYSRSQVPFSDA
jgi:hypothetical protein